MTHHEVEQELADTLDPGAEGRIVNPATGSQVWEYAKVIGPAGGGTMLYDCGRAPGRRSATASYPASWFLSYELAVPDAEMAERIAATLAVEVGGEWDVSVETLPEVARTELDAENPPSGLGTGLCARCRAPIGEASAVCRDCPPEGPAEFYIGRRAFPSAMDGQPLVELDLRSDHTKEGSGLDWFISREAERLGPDVVLSDDEVCDMVLPAAMSWAAGLLTAAYGLRGDQADIEAMEGNILVAAEHLPEAHRSSGVARLTITLEELPR